MKLKKKFILFALIILISISYSDSRCPDVCVDGSYYSNGYYDPTVQDCYYDYVEYCENGCLLDIACEYLEGETDRESVIPDCPNYCDGTTYYEGGYFNSQTLECEYSTISECGLEEIDENEIIEEFDDYEIIEPNFDFGEIEEVEVENKEQYCQIQTSKGKYTKGKIGYYKQIAIVQENGVKTSYSEEFLFEDFCVDSNTLVEYSCGLDCYTKSEIENLAAGLGLSAQIYSNMKEYECVNLNSNNVYAVSQEIKCKCGCSDGKCASEEDSDLDGISNCNDSDDDNDSIIDSKDNCPLIKNKDQEDNDKDGSGDACDLDYDNDGILNDKDNCKLIKNPDQRDYDKDGLGNSCDTDDDNDGIADEKDNCPLLNYKDQSDIDNDGIGDACDCEDAHQGPFEKWNDCGGYCIAMKNGIEFYPEDEDILKKLGVPQAPSAIKTCEGSQNYDQCCSEQIKLKKVENNEPWMGQCYSCYTCFEEDKNLEAIRLTSEDKYDRYDIMFFAGPNYNGKMDKFVDDSKRSIRKYYFKLNKILGINLLPKGYSDSLNIYSYMKPLSSNKCPEIKSLDFGELYVVLNSPGKPGFGLICPNNSPPKPEPVCN